MNSKDPIRAALKENEELIWSGAPKRGLWFEWYDILVVPFTGLWLAILVVWESILLFAWWQLVKMESAGLLIASFVPMGVGFAAIIVSSFFVGRFFISAYIRSKTTYGLTNQRILVSSPIVGKPRTIPFSKVKDLVINQKRGSIYFSGNLERYVFGAISSLMGLPMSCFEKIENAEWVYHQIATLTKNANPPSLPQPDSIPHANPSS